MASILIIDDEPDIRDFLTRTLEHVGHEVRAASDAEMGLALYRAHPADLVITDLLMAGKEGLMMIADLKEEDAKAKILAISGGNTKVGPDKYLAAATDFGAVRTLAKPFGQAALLQAVAALLSQDTGVSAPVC